MSLALRGATWFGRVGAVAALRQRGASDRVSDDLARMHFANAHGLDHDMPDKLPQSVEVHAPPGSEPGQLPTLSRDVAVRLAEVSLPATEIKRMKAEVEDEDDVDEDENEDENESDDTGSESE